MVSPHPLPVVRLLVKVVRVGTPKAMLLHTTHIHIVSVDWGWHAKKYRNKIGMI